MDHKKHGRHTHTTIHHHTDGSHTMDRHHEDGHTVSSAHADLDGVHDALQEHLGQPNAGEEAAEMGQHGVPGPMAQMAGLPPQGM